MNRNQLIINLLNKANEKNYNDEVNPIIADMFIYKYSNEKNISETMASIILTRFESILNESAYWRKCERDSLNKLF